MWAIVRCGNNLLTEWSYTELPDWFNIRVKYINNQQILTSKKEFVTMITISHKRQKWQRLIAGRLAAAAEFYITTTAQETSYWTR